MDNQAKAKGSADIALAPLDIVSKENNYNYDFKEKTKKKYKGLGFIGTNSKFVRDVLNWGVPILLVGGTTYALTQSSGNDSRKPRPPDDDGDFNPVTAKMFNVAIPGVEFKNPAIGIGVNFSFLKN